MLPQLLAGKINLNIHSSLTLKTHTNSSLYTRIGKREMEGSKSEAIFESLNLSPQLFINEVLNVVDDLLNEAFKFFLQSDLFHRPSLLITFVYPALPSL